MSNMTNVAERHVPSAIGYAVQGSLIGFTNLCIGLSILKQSALRQLNQYVLLMALAFADAANMFAFSFAGLHRLWVIYSGQYFTRVTPLSCLVRPHAWMWMVAYVYAPLMLIVVSADRLFLVSFPSTYLLSLPSPGYAKRFAGIGFIFTVIMAGVGAASVFTVPNTYTVHPFCYVPVMYLGGDVLADVYVKYFRYTSYFALSSVVIFIAVPIANSLQSQHLCGAEMQRNQKTQREMTKTMAVSSLCTLCLYCIPDRMAYHVAANWEGDLAIWGSRALWLLSMWNPGANLFIYQLRHEELRVAFKALFTRKKLPMNLTLWPKKAREVTQAAQQNFMSKGVGPSSHHAKAVRFAKPENLKVEDVV